MFESDEGRLLLTLLRHLLSHLQRESGEVSLFAKTLCRGDGGLRVYESVVPDTDTSSNGPLTDRSITRDISGDGPH